MESNCYLKTVTGKTKCSNSLSHMLQHKN